MRSLLILSLAFHAALSFSQTSTGTGAGAVTGSGSTLVEAGIPALSREWTGEDYLQVSKVLAQGRLPLPRVADETGRRFIQRLTDIENLSLFQNRTLPLQNRMPNFLSLMQAAGAISKQYLAASNQGIEVHEELALQQAFELRVAATGMELMEEFVPTIPKDEKYEVRMAGVKQAISGLTSMYVGAEMSLSETRLYTPADLTVLLKAMAETLPVVQKAFSADYRLELRRKMEAHQAAFPGAEDAKMLQQIIAALGA